MKGSDSISPTVPPISAKHEVEVVGLGARERLDGVGDVRDHLHRGAEIVAPPLALDDRLVDSARGDVVALTRRDAGEAFVMSKVEIGLRAVIGDVDLAVLVRTHRARIDVQIGIELADAHAITARLKQCRQRRRHETLAERRDHAAGDEDIPRHGDNRLAEIRGARQAAGRRPARTTRPASRNQRWRGTAELSTGAVPFSAAAAAAAPWNGAASCCPP